ncbi:uncharacterized protein AMSG_01685 [Thecamonas trahens ATCC 50062]|uniref:RING-type domain-containing protein n=1 Tax=Thecamonas trahens ATCC 50062 TaxID=461836 RepID=A0A0L0DTN0_THETB|nr:hypothetical protein AMSG_01685 [Thecamonas trahens ATCC 50062]KNC54833.1 hypothetical protein AMSG_01685 [Thecamonas trahens ATCC 50062]|eukprot:XP_013761730.1 hypothetical protein AMSG_01685 [Thecamonas trahens ATCC 50062]
MSSHTPRGLKNLVALSRAPGASFSAPASSTGRPVEAKAGMGATSESDDQVAAMLAASDQLKVSQMLATAGLAPEEAAEAAAAAAGASDSAGSASGAAARLVPLLREELGLVRDQLATAERNFESVSAAHAQAQRELEELRSQNAALVSQAPDVAAAALAAAAAQEKVDVASAEAAKARSALAAITRERDAAQAKVAHLTKAQGLAAEQIKKLRREAADAQFEKGKLASLVEASQRQSSALNAELASMATSLTVAEASLESVRNENVALKAALAAAEAQAVAASSAEDAAARLDAALDEAAALKSELLEMRSSAQARKLELDAALADKDAAESALASRDARIRDLMASAASSADDEVPVYNESTGESSHSSRSYAPAPVMAALVKARGALRSTLADLLTAERAAESSLTCLVCLGGLNEPILFPTCEHVVCEGCAPADLGQCPECEAPNEARFAGPLRVDALETLASKSQFKLQSLQAASEQLDVLFAAVYAAVGAGAVEE